MENEQKNVNADVVFFSFVFFSVSCILYSDSFILLEISKIIHVVQ